MNILVIGIYFLMLMCMIFSPDRSEAVNHCVVIPGKICDFICSENVLLLEKIAITLLLLGCISYGYYYMFNRNAQKKKSKNKKKSKTNQRVKVLFNILSVFFFLGSIFFTLLLASLQDNTVLNCRMEFREAPRPLDEPVHVLEKPIIYLYPEEKQNIQVALEVEGEIIADYPEYDDGIKGWNVMAYPDGKIIDHGKEYSYLFWEAEFDNNNWDLSQGFIVEGKDARKFLQEKLSYIGLTPKEYNEFIVYWYPKMMNNKYNLVYFAGDDYDSRAPLNIYPEPDSILRVFTVIQPLDQKIEIEEQKLEKFERKGFSVIEWGGTILD